MQRTSDTLSDGERATAPFWEESPDQWLPVWERPRPGAAPRAVASLFAPTAPPSMRGARAYALGEQPVSARGARVYLPHAVAPNRYAYEADLGSLPWRGVEAEAAPAAPGADWRALLQELAETAVLTVLIFVLMRALIQNYRIEGYSMEPNLHEKQYLIVNKVAYYIGEPQRGDIIVFEYPKGDPNGPERDYIKRIIGLPGDTIECRPNEILVNGEVIEEPYGPNPWTYNHGPITLGPDEYFVLGDNRPASSDSQEWGPLERKYIIGKAWLSYWPLDMMGRVPNYPLQAPTPQPGIIAQEQ